MTTMICHFNQLIAPLEALLSTFRYARRRLDGQGLDQPL
jgi:hypothetical protein